MSNTNIGDIWVYKNKWHYLIVEQCSPPYHTLYQAIRMEDNERPTINPFHESFKHLWAKVA